MILSSTVYCFWYWLLRHIATNSWPLQLTQNDILKRNTKKRGKKEKKEAVYMVLYWRGSETKADITFFCRRHTEYFKALFQLVVTHNFK